MSNPFTTKDPLADVIKQVVLGEKKLTDAELKKREEIVLAIKRENPDMEKSRAYAIATAQAKKVAEEVEQIDEISDKTLGNYVSKAVVDVHNDAKFAGESGSKDASKKAFKRLLGVKSAAARLSKQNVSGGRISNYRAEEVNLQEITTKSGADVDRNLDDHDPEEHGDIPDRKPDHELETHGGTTLHVHHVKDSKGKTTHTIINHVHDPAGGGTFVVKGHAHPKHILSSYNRAEREDMYESVNLDEQLENFWEAYTTMFNEAEDQQQNMLLRAMAKDPSDLMKMKRAIKMGDKALTNPALRQEILAMLDKMMNLTTADPSLLQRTKMGFQKAKKLKMPEEVQLEAIGAKDKQDEGEYGYEGDMAMSQLRTIIRNCQEMMKVLDKETDMPEWVQSKITLATDYLQTANDYLMSELEEEVAKDAPFEGGREVKSKESAAVRVKKIALGKKKQYTPKKDKM
jgi:hypothetical protein